MKQLGIKPGNIQIVDNGPDAVVAYADLIAKADRVLVLMDVEMPGGDGITAASRIFARYPQAEIVFCTSVSPEEFSKMCLEKNITIISPRFISKQATLAELGSLLTPPPVVTHVAQPSQ